MNKRIKENEKSSHPNLNYFLFVLEFYTIGI